MANNMIMELRRQQAEIVERASAINEAAAVENRGLTDAEQVDFDALTAEAERVQGAVEREEKLNAYLAKSARVEARGVPAYNKLPLGVDEKRAIAHYIKTGDQGAIREFRASNDTDMNIGTQADGGYAVPTGHYSGIIAKRDAVMLADKLGVLRIPGQGATTNVPVDNGSANAFVATNEAASFDRDAPALGQAAFTLVWYTKKVQLSYQLLKGEDSNLLAFLENYVGRAYGLTHNTLLVTEALANGTSVTLGTAAAANEADPASVIYSLKGEYAEGAQWIMKRATDGAYRKLTGNVFQFAPTGGSLDGLWNYPINWSESVAAIGAGNKSLVFGNFAFMGLYESPSMTFIRDPYSAAGSGQVNLFYHFGAVYKVMVAEAVLYGKHPTA